MITRLQGDVPVMECHKCGYVKKLKSNEAKVFRRSITISKPIERKDVDIIGIPSIAIYDERIVCPKCGNRGVYYWRKHGSSAESSDIIEKVYRCKYCGYEWSEIE